MDTMETPAVETTTSPGWNIELVERSVRGSGARAPLSDRARIAIGLGALAATLAIGGALISNLANGDGADSTRSGATVIDGSDSSSAISFDGGASPSTAASDVDRSQAATLLDGDAFADAVADATAEAESGALLNGEQLDRAVEASVAGG